MELNKYIDHTYLKPFAMESDIIRICDEAKKYHFASVCVNPCNVPLVAKELAGSDVAVCSVVGFPLVLILLRRSCLRPEKLWTMEQMKSIW